jgi:AraC family transcriptional regulator
MNPQIITKEALLLAGFSFFGDPFATKNPWNEENEIGRLWQRFIFYMQQHGTGPEPVIAQSGAFYEVHLHHATTPATGEFEVFVGAAITRPEALPVELVAKLLPPTRYAVFTIAGEKIHSDWHQTIYQQWMPAAGYSSAYPFNFQYYDERFKGMDNLAASVIDVYVPIK